jgi:uncharacterized protein (DUF433 family)
MSTTADSSDWQQFLNAGLYTVPMAARLVAAHQSKVRSWIEGYSSSEADPIIHRELPKVGGRTVLGFLDLIETAFIRHFRMLGYSPQTIRKVAVKLRERHDIDHPFAMGKRFRADGKSIFEEAVDDEGERRLLNVMTDNFMMVDVVEQSLFDQILYVDDLARLWKPIPRFSEIVIDPRRAFGKPIVASKGVPTELIYHDYDLAGDEVEVAEEYGLSLEETQQAIGFEQELNSRTLH